MKNLLKIFYVVPEVYPFATTGDLALVANSFPKYIKNLGHDIRVMMPKYKVVNERKYILREVIRLQGLKIKLAEETHAAKSKSAFLPNSKVQIYFLDNKKYFDRNGLYFDSDSEILYDDTAERFIFFAIGCLETLKLLYWQPDIIHCNDWQTALIPMLLKTLYKDDSFFKNTKTLLTVHNPNSIGEFSNASFKSIGFEEDKVNSQHKILGTDKLSFLYSGLQYADILSVGSSKITAELEAALTKIGRNKNEVAMIAPQIDIQVWNADEDKLIPKTYNSENLDGKRECKQVLVEEYGLNFEEDVPVFFTIINTENTVNIKLFESLLKNLLKLKLSILIGCTRKNKTFELLQEKCSNLGDKCKIMLIEDDASIHKAVAGADVLLQASCEQNGIVNPSISLKYGTIPIFGNEFSLEKVIAKGYISDGYSSSFTKSDIPDLLKSIKELVKEFSTKEKWQLVIRKAMSNEFSWENPAQEYIKLCQKIAQKKSSEF